jgi:hypothetical protein
VIRGLLQVLDFLFAIEHLPALNAKDLTVRFGLDDFQLGDEIVPFFRKHFDHFFDVCD